MPCFITFSYCYCLAIICPPICTNSFSKHPVIGFSLKNLSCPNKTLTQLKADNVSPVSLSSRRGRRIFSSYLFCIFCSNLPVWPWRAFSPFTTVALGFTTRASLRKEVHTFESLTFYDLNYVWLMYCKLSLFLYSIKFICVVKYNYLVTFWWNFNDKIRCLKNEAVSGISFTTVALGL